MNPFRLLDKAMYIFHPYQLNYYIKFKNYNFFKKKYSLY